jgi:SNF2 family DNA or RNA helicase
MSEVWQPHPKQREALDFLLRRNYAGLLLDPGCGKTSISLEAVRILKEVGQIKKVLLIAPLLVCQDVWGNEIDKWSQFNHLRYGLMHGKDKNTVLKGDYDIYAVNFEGLDWLMQLDAHSKVPNLAKFKALGFDALIVDELSRFKHVDTKRFKMFKHLLKSFNIRWGLTGSPASRNLEDLFGECYTLDEGATLGRFITHYRSQFFVPDPSGFGYKVRHGAEPEIYKKISPLMLRMAAEDVIPDMPLVQFNDLFIDLPPKAREIYDSLEDDLIAKFEDKTVVATNAAVAMSKCCQVANGSIYLDPEYTELGLKSNGREWVQLHTAKLDRLELLVDELQGQPLFVAHYFKHDLDALKTRFPKAHCLGGGMSTEEVRKTTLAWNKGEIPLLFANPASVAHGLNLQYGGHHVAFFSMVWDFELYDQFIRRVRRQGSRSEVVYVHHILARKTVDLLMLKALKSKDKVQQELFKGLKELQEKRKSVCNGAKMW